MKPVSVLTQADDVQLEQAAADNHQQLFCLNAIAMGGDVVTNSNITYTAIPGQGATVAFPHLTAENAGPVLDDMMEYYRQYPPAKGIGYWSLNPPEPADVGVRLLARGFQPGWQPRWMALALDAFNLKVTLPAYIQVQVANEVIVRGIKDLPFAEDNAYFSQLLLETFPEMAFRLIAFEAGNIVGQTCVFFNQGSQGIAGIYNVGVLPRLQRKGIGTALMIATCNLAKERGYNYAMLNANDTGRGLYEQVGFKTIGYGCTWWMKDEVFLSEPPSAALVILAEAVGIGNMQLLEQTGRNFTVAELNKPLVNGMTLLQLAVYYQQTKAAEWLAGHGATYTVLDAWDLGWKDSAAKLLKDHPEAINQRYYDWKGTLLHVAAERNDLALARLALDAGVDLSIKDVHHDGTALGWAHFFGRQALIELIDQSQK